MVTQEQITLQNLINEFENKINEKENQLMTNKEKIKQYILDMQNKPIIKKTNNGINSNYNYNYYIKQEADNGKNNIKNLMNYNINNRAKLNDFNNNNKISIHTIDSSNNDKNRDMKGNKNGTTYALMSNQQDNYLQDNNKDEQLDNYESDLNSQSNTN